MARGCDHGAARGRRAPACHTGFAKVSWAFVDAYIDQTIARRGRWRHLSAAQQREIAATFRRSDASRSSTGSYRD
jgi:DNA-binding IclR family transcriptional regulator